MHIISEDFNFFFLGKPRKIYKKNRKNAFIGLLSFTFVMHYESMITNKTRINIKTDNHEKILHPWKSNDYTLHVKKSINTIHE
jgi:hypothetical protein